MKYTLMGSLGNITQPVAQQLIETGHQVTTLQHIATVLGKAIDMPELKYVAFSDEAALKGYLDMGLNENIWRRIWWNWVVLPAKGR